MTHTAAKRVKMLCSMAVMLVLVASIIAVPAFALDTGIYTATATPHYRDPSTGSISDTGGENSEVLGQAMTESVTHNKALVEVDQNGNTFVTLRLKLMDNIDRTEFLVDGKVVSASCTQEDFEHNSADFRMQVPDKNAVIEANLHVTAMGRDVVYFVTLSNLQFGADDFVTSIDAPMTGELPEEEQQTAPTEATPAPAEKQDASANQTDEPMGMQEFDASGHDVTKDKGTDGDTAKTGNVVWLVVGIAAVAGIGFCVWYFGFFRKKH